MVDRHPQGNIYFRCPIGLGWDELKGEFRLLVLGSCSQYKFGEE